MNLWSLVRTRFGRTPLQGAIKDPEALGDQFLRELRDLLDAGEIDAASGRRILDDLLEAADPDRRPKLKISAWLVYAEHQRTLRLLASARAGLHSDGK